MQFILKPLNEVRKILSHQDRKSKRYSHSTHSTQNSLAVSDVFFTTEITPIFVDKNCLFCQNLTYEESR
jgi:hypothetical protein